MFWLFYNFRHILPPSVTIHCFKALMLFHQTENTQIQHHINPWKPTTTQWFIRGGLFYFIAGEMLNRRRAFKKQRQSFLVQKDVGRTWADVTLWQFDQTMIIPRDFFRPQQNIWHNPHKQRKTWCQLCLWVKSWWVCVEFQVRMCSKIINLFFQL